MKVKVDGSSPLRRVSPDRIRPADADNTLWGTLENRQRHGTNSKGWIETGPSALLSQRLSRAV
ncbi:hypothetical protein AArcMg_2765 [Natrarchaeobaculum sulfurireducens]|uniref:Uncharacterized protein n=1 Tax=Natrarchaeobaculum sulfurireducens TaxID=2044521 RepID=A0A346PTB0_9EURY|nr:hypothetical protein AArcMg_2765 [Natrarchaeobaculum sulfurireducens]